MVRLIVSHKYCIRNSIFTSYFFYICFVNGCVCIVVCVCVCVLWCVCDCVLWCVYWGWEESCMKKALHYCKGQGCNETLLQWMQRFLPCRVCVCLCSCMCMHVLVYVCVCACISVFMCVCMHVCVCACICACTCVCVHSCASVIRKVC